MEISQPMSIFCPVISLLFLRPGSNAIRHYAFNFGSFREE
jgi:hypothetical protein